ncbi:TerB family tellurite resistance protein, partial [Parvibaculum sp.]
MFEKIRNALQKGLTTTGNVPMSPEAKQLAAAALLVEAGNRDREFTDGEREAIKRIVTEHFTVNADEAADLLKV